MEMSSNVNWGMVGGWLVEGCLRTRELWEGERAIESGMMGNPPHQISSDHVKVK